MWGFGKLFEGSKISDHVSFSYLGGISVCVLDGSSAYGTHIWTGISIKDFIREYPKYAEAKIKKYNDFYGELILRVEEVE